MDGGGAVLQQHSRSCRHRWANQATSVNPQLYLKILWHQNLAALYIGPALILCTELPGKLLNPPAIRLFVAIRHVNIHTNG